MARGAARGIGEAGPFEVDGVQFVPAWNRPSERGSLTLLKAPRMVARYQELLAAYPNPRLVELGISQGGSVALLALLARPERFVAVELDPTPIDPLLEVLAERTLDATVHPYFGVDQGDRDRLARIVAEEFAGAPLDVVIDDASHRYGPSVASFEVLFPLLRPGGAYVVEDWNWQDLTAQALAVALEDPASPHHEGLRSVVTEVVEGRASIERPLSCLAVELALAQAHAGGAVAEVVLDEDWILVRRGDQELDPATFRLTDLYRDHYGLLAT